MFKLEFTFATWAEAQAAMATMSGAQAAPAAAEPPAPAKAEAKKAIEKAAKVESPKPQAAPAAEPPAHIPTATVTVTATPPAPAPAEPAAESPSKAITLEEVRAKLASLAQSGKAAEVKGLIAAVGHTKLTDIPAEKYSELLEKAAAL